MCVVLMTSHDVSQAKSVVIFKKLQGPLNISDCDRRGEKGKKENK